jgi:hypothetical protein
MKSAKGKLKASISQETRWKSRNDKHIVVIVEPEEAKNELQSKELRGEERVKYVTKFNYEAQIPRARKDLLIQKKSPRLLNPSSTVNYSSIPILPRDSTESFKPGTDCTTPPTPCLLEAAFTLGKSSPDNLGVEVHKNIAAGSSVEFQPRSHGDTGVLASLKEKIRVQAKKVLHLEHEVLPKLQAQLSAQTQKSTCLQDELSTVVEHAQTLEQKLSEANQLISRLILQNEKLLAYESAREHHDAANVVDDLDSDQQEAAYLSLSSGRITGEAAENAELKGFEYLTETENQIKPKSQTRYRQSCTDQTTQTEFMVGDRDEVSIVDAVGYADLQQEQELREELATSSQLLVLEAAKHMLQSKLLSSVDRKTSAFIESSTRLGISKAVQQPAKPTSTGNSLDTVTPNLLSILHLLTTTLSELSQPMPAAEFHTVWEAVAEIRQTADDAVDALVLRPLTADADVKLRLLHQKVDALRLNCKPTAVYNGGKYITWEPA